MDVEVAGERLELLSARAVHWPARKTLFVADLHLGKAGALRAKGLALPDGSATRTLQRLSEVLSETRAERLIVLGDFWHAPAGRSEALLREIENWRRLHSEVALELVRGNHDRGLQPVGWDWIVRTEHRVETPFVFAHYPEADPDGYVLAGHLHPGVRLSGRGSDRLRLSCFWIGDRVAVLPAFGELTGLADFQAKEGDRVFIVAGEQVHELPPVRKSRCR